MELLKTLLLELKVINCYATEPVSLANGGVNQVISTFLIDPKI